MWISAFSSPQIEPVFLYRWCVCLSGTRGFSSGWNQGDVPSTVAPSHVEFSALERSFSRAAYAFMASYFCSPTEVLFLFHITHFSPLKATGTWCMRVTMWSTIFSAHFSKVNAYKFLIVFCAFAGINLCFWHVAGLVAAGWDLKRNLLDWDEWRVEWKIKNKWTPAMYIRFTLK